MPPLRPTPIMVCYTTRDLEEFSNTCVTRDQSVVRERQNGMIITVNVTLVWLTTSRSHRLRYKLAKCGVNIGPFNRHRRSRDKEGNYL